MDRLAYKIVSSLDTLCLQKITNCNGRAFTRLGNKSNQIKYFINQSRALEGQQAKLQIHI